MQTRATCLKSVPPKLVYVDECRIIVSRSRIAAMTSPDTGTHADGTTVSTLLGLNANICNVCRVVPLAFRVGAHQLRDSPRRQKSEKVFATVLVDARVLSGFTQNHLTTCCPVFGLTMRPSSQSVLDLF